MDQGLPINDDDTVTLFERTFQKAHEAVVSGSGPLGAGAPPATLTVTPLSITRFDPTTCFCALAELFSLIGPMP